jgi:hypothetical protein
MNAFLLKNERKTLMDTCCLLFSQVFGSPLLEGGQVEDRSRSSGSSSAVQLRSRKKTLNRRCAPQDMPLRMPPQEQGTRFQKCSSTRTMYPVNDAISTADSHKPPRWVTLKDNRPAVSNSSGIRVYNNISAIQPGKDWLSSCPRKSAKVSHLLTPA